MSDVANALQYLLDIGELDNKDPKVSEIAKLAIAKGVDHLTGLQLAVLAPYLQRVCGGVTDPEGHHNECHTILEGDELATALEKSGYYGRALCDDCINESEQYSNDQDRISLTEKAHHHHTPVTLH